MSNVGAMPGGDLPEGMDQTRHRLEAFSDIVIALALSQLAFGLRLPDSSHDLIAHPLHFVSFVASFVFICALWWIHHQLFARYFIPDVASATLNFAFLAAVVFVAYALQVLSKFGDSLSIAAYALSMGLAFSLLTVLFAKGLRDPRLALDEDARRRGNARTLRLTIISAGFLASVVVAALGRNVKEIAATWLAAVAIVAVLGVRERLARGKSARVGAPEALP